MEHLSSYPLWSRRPRLLGAACHTHAVLEQERTARESRRSRLEAALPGMVERLKTLGAKRVVLFGSLARGEVGKRSDVDLIVVLDAPGRFLDRLALVDEALRDRDVPLDALVYTSDEFAELSRSRPFVRRALREGRVLYEA